MTVLNKQQKEILQAQLDSEKKAIRELKQVYNQALRDVNEKISVLSARADMNPSELQSIIYQKQYQQAIKGQLDGIMANLQSNEYATISDYLTRCYQDGYIGTMYDLQKQGIPLTIPIDQKQATKAIQLDSKLSNNLYGRLGEDVSKLKTSVRAEISRGIANGSSWLDMAGKISKSMKNTPFEKAINNSIRIARTEGHRIQNAATLDAQYKAKEKGANVVKQWDATLDGATRDTHRQLDGQIKEVDEDFEVNGLRASAPGMFGDPAEDCNCRCSLLQKAKWALDDKELETLKDRAEYFGLDKSKDFEDYKEKYLQVSEGLGANDDYNGVPEHKEPEIINTIDFNDDEAVKYVIEDFENQAVSKKIETACVITKDGTVYECYGTETRVFPDYDLGDKLVGAKVSHNHPIDYSEYSFSNDDFNLFMDYNLEVLRGCDEKYNYEFNRNSNNIDEHISIFDITEEDAMHEVMIINAENAHIGYHRWKNE